MNVLAIAAVVAVVAGIGALIFFARKANRTASTGSQPKSLPPVVTQPPASSPTK